MKCGDVKGQSVHTRFGFAARNVFPSQARTPDKDLARGAREACSDAKRTRRCLESVKSEPMRSSPLVLADRFFVADCLAGLRCLQIDNAPGSFEPRALPSS